MFCQLYPQVCLHCINKIYNGFVLFPKGWFDVSSDSQCLVFSKMQVYNYTVDLILNLTAIVCIQLSYTLKVTYDFLWTFQIQGEVVNLSSAHLAPLPSKLQSAGDED